jgi:2-iminobutanoate/2-iminopropanoate deaminase
MKIVKTQKAPSAVGPYSQAVISGGFVFVSGQIPLGLDGKLNTGDIKEQTKQVMENLGAILQEAGSGFEKVVKTTIYLADINDFVAVNEVYGSYFVGEYLPARATVGVAALPKGAKVEVECVGEV